MDYTEIISLLSL